MNFGERESRVYISGLGFRKALVFMFFFFFLSLKKFFFF